MFTVTLSNNLLILLIKYMCTNIGYARNYVFDLWLQYVYISVQSIYTSIQMSL